MIRNTLMIVYALAWGTVVVIKAAQGQEITAELWGALGAGEGFILGLFPRAENTEQGRRDTPAEPVEDKPA